MLSVKGIQSHKIIFCRSTCLLACGYSRLSFAPATTCKTQRQTSAIHRQKFHTDDVNLPALNGIIKIASHENNTHEKDEKLNDVVVAVTAPFGNTMDFIHNHANETLLINFAFEHISPPFRCKFRPWRRVNKCHIPSLDALQNLLLILLWNPKSRFKSKRR